MCTFDGLTHTSESDTLFATSRSFFCLDFSLFCGWLSFWLTHHSFIFDYKLVAFKVLVAMKGRNESLCRRKRTRKMFTPS